MIEWLANYGLFLAKAVTIVLSILLCVGGVIALGSRNKKGQPKGSVTVKNLNKKYEKLTHQLQESLMEESAFKSMMKQKDKEEKAKQKALKKKKKSKKDDSGSDFDSEDTKKRMFVLDFDGDVKASAVENLSKEVNAILSVSKPSDEVVLRLESPGGVVHGYGLAASQLKRITDHGLQLTICVDKVAASGGYMMACIANKIVAAPFAIIGSIGVVASLPNFNRLLKKHDIDYDIYTAGEYKRTVTMLGENTEEGKKKLNEDLHETHVLFKAMIQENRPQLNIDEVATGEVWYGQQAIDKKLIDEVGTSDAYLMAALPDAKLYQISYVKKKKMADKLGLGISAVFDRVINQVATDQSKNAL